MTDGILCLWKESALIPNPRKAIYIGKYSTVKSRTEIIQDMVFAVVTSQLVSDKNGDTQVFKIVNRPSYYPLEGASQKLLNHWKKTNKQN